MGREGEAGGREGAKEGMDEGSVAVDAMAHARGGENGRMISTRSQWNGNGNGSPRHGRVAREGARCCEPIGVESYSRGALNCLPAVVVVMELAIGGRRSAVCIGGRVPPCLLADLGLGLSVDRRLAVNRCLAVRRDPLATSLVLEVCAHVGGPWAVVTAAGHLKGRKGEG